ncbi:Hypothetical predicted protein [Octopus vulgaris]|uniref:Uncharacterized protein n=1 Tax=Octopus vulgaris TaxID=6645 RepID=A0AA36FDU9_OCTVU|nr:Hypothetical predicted protein [Octopus vulgaris]
MMILGAELEPETSVTVAITLKEPDKGGMIMNMDRGYHKDKNIETSNRPKLLKRRNKKFKKKTIMNKVRTLINKYPDSTDNDMNYLSNTEIKESKFYELPKIKYESDFTFHA